MFPILLAALIWLFAKGKYSQYLAFATTSTANSTQTPAAASTSTSSSNGSGSSSSSLGGLGSLSSLGGLFASGSENTGASSTSTPDDLIAGYTG